MGNLGEASIHSSHGSYHPRVPRATRAAAAQGADSSGKTPRSNSVSLKMAEEELVEVTSATFVDVDFNGAPAEMDDDVLGVVAALVNKPFCFALTSLNRRRDVYRIAYKLVHEASIFAEQLERHAPAYVTHDAIVKRLGIVAAGEVDKLLHGFRSLAGPRTIPGTSRKRKYEAYDANDDKENVKCVLPGRVLAALLLEFEPEVKGNVQANTPMRKVRS